MRNAEAAYHRINEENISYWWAAEEDVIDSATKLVNNTENEKVKSTLSEIVPDLNHIEVLDERELQEDAGGRAAPRKNVAGILH